MCGLVGVAERDAQHLEVEALLVAHLEPADRPGPDVTAGEGRLVDDQERVGVVAVACPRPFDEPVVEVVEDRRRENAIEPEDAARLVELVLVAAAARDLDDDLDDVGKRSPRAHAAPCARCGRCEAAGDARIDDAIGGPPADRVGEGLAERSVCQPELSRRARRVDGPGAVEEEIEPSGLGERAEPAAGDVVQAGHRPNRRARAGRAAAAADR